MLHQHLVSGLHITFTPLNPIKKIVQAIKTHSFLKIADNLKARKVVGRLKCGKLFGDSLHFCQFFRLRKNDFVVNSSVVEFGNGAVVRILDHDLFGVDFGLVEVVEHLGFATFGCDGLRGFIEWRLWHTGCDLVSDGLFNFVWDLSNVDVFTCYNGILVLDGGFLDAAG
jgi:hypothetical protein